MESAVVPALILTRTPALGVLRTATVAPVTTTIRDIPAELRLAQAEGTKTVCVAQFDAPQTISKHRIGRYIGCVDPKHKTEIREALLFALELDEQGLSDTTPPPDAPKGESAAQDGGPFQRAGVAASDITSGFRRHGVGLTVGSADADDPAPPPMNLCMIGSSAELRRS